MAFDKVIGQSISIIRVVFEFYPLIGGSITHTMELSKKIDPYLENQLIIAPKFNSFSNEFDRSFGIPIYRVDYPRWIERHQPFGLPVMQFVVAWYALNAAKIIKNIFKNNTVIDIHGILLGAILTIILNKIMRLNLPVVIHQDSANIFKIDQRSILTAKLAFLLFRISKPSRLVVVDDGNMLNQYLEILNNYKIRYETVDHAIDIDLYRPTMKNDIRDEFIILSTQRFIPFRRVDFCILAMKNLIERNINNRQIFKLILVGSGTDMAMLKNLAVLEEISDNITFAGQQNQQDVIEYLNIADVVIGTSLKTNLTLSTQEAMACGKPVVVFEAGRTNLLISHMENGLLANPGDPLDLAEKIEILYKDIHLRQTIGKNARKTIIENRDWKARVKKELAIYKNVLA